MAEPVLTKETKALIALIAASAIMVGVFPGTPKKGVTITYCYQQDYEALRATWYYTWGENGCGWGTFIPMIYDGLPQGNIPTAYDGWLLVFNEPNNFPPYGVNISPETAAVRYLALREKYPDAKFVVGGVSAFAGWWLDAFDQNIPADKRPERYHIHTYLEAYITVDYIRKVVEHHQYMGRTLWVTEAGATDGDPQQFMALQQYLETEPAIERYAFFTNRATGREPWYPQGWDVQLVDQAGSLTKLGAIYAGKDYRFYNFLPYIAR